MGKTAVYFYGINAIGERSIPLLANTTMGVSMFLGGGTLAPTLAANAQGSQALGQENINRIIEQLDARFQRAPAVESSCTSSPLPPSRALAEGRRR